MDLQELIGNFGRDQPIAAQAIGLIGLVAIGLIANVVASRWMLSAMRRFARMSSNNWDDALVRAHFFQRLANLAPILVIYFGVHALGANETVELVVQRVALATYPILFVAVIRAFLNAVNAIHAPAVS